MNNIELFNQVKDIIDTNYAFLSEEKHNWDNIVREKKEKVNGTENMSSFLDDMLIALKDPHTRIQSITKTDEVHDFNCLWFKNKLVVMPNLYGYKNPILGGEIISVNNINIEEINDIFKNKFNGFPDSIIKEEVIKYIRKNFENDKLSLKIIKNNIEYLEDIKKLDLNKLKSSYPDIIGNKTNEFVPVFVKKVDEDAVLIKIISFRNKNIVDFIIDKENLIKNSNVIIFDIRDNRGGFISETKKLLSNILDTDVELDYKLCTRDEVSMENVKVKPNHNYIFSNKNIYIICNENTMSSSEFIFIHGLKKGYRNVKLIGSCTAGMSGQAKTFILKSGDILQVTVKKYITKFDQQIKDGFIPDYIIDIKADDYLNNHDQALEFTRSLYNKEKSIAR